MSDWPCVRYLRPSARHIKLSSVLANTLKNADWAVNQSKANRCWDVVGEYLDAAVLKTL